MNGFWFMEDWVERKMVGKGFFGHCFRGFFHEEKFLV